MPVDFEVNCDPARCFFVRFTHSGSCLMDVQLKEGYMMMILYL